MIAFPRSVAEAAALPGELRAGGTDLQERLASGVASGPIVDLRDVPGLDCIVFDDDGAARIGALVSVAAVASDARVAAAYPGLAQAAGALATPQIRTVATVGGNLLQRTRCWYYRHPLGRCAKRGDAGCPARSGNHRHGVCFDRGPCVAPHPSTLALALLAYEARYAGFGAPARPLVELYGDGSDPRRDHLLPAGAVLTGVELAPPLAGERAAYFRATVRAAADWPLAEALVRLAFEGETVTFARVAIGAVAPVPLRLPHVERTLLGERMTAAVLDAATAAAIHGANPLPGTRYKLDLVTGTVRTAIELAIAPE